MQSLGQEWVNPIDFRFISDTLIGMTTTSNPIHPMTPATAGRQVRALLATIEEVETGIDHYTAESLSANTRHVCIEIALSEARTLVGMLETLYILGAPQFGSDQCSECGRWCEVHDAGCSQDDR